MTRRTETPHFVSLLIVSFVNPGKIFSRRSVIKDWKCLPKALLDVTIS